ncbi:MAG: phage holin family protein [Clostridiales bacterium]|jgi:putative membrane protein|nr:phage holin family protein [Clostridiales bacterium]
MKRLLINWVLSAICLYVIAWLFPGITLSGFMSAMIAALVLGLVNALIKPIISLLTLPLTIVTLGLFSLVINALMLMLTSHVVSGFSVNGFGTAFFAAIVLSVLNLLFLSGRDAPHRV